MNEEEINKVIAEYMGLISYNLPVLHSFSYSLTDDHSEDFLKQGNDGFWFLEKDDTTGHSIIHCSKMLYTKSLDALVPVVEKLRFNDWSIIRNLDYGGHDCLVERSIRVSSKKSPSLALATACAKVIQTNKEKE